MFMRKVKALVTFNGYQQRDLADKVRINVAMLNLFLNRRYQLKEKDLMRFCKVMNLDYKAFLKERLKVINPNKKEDLSMVDALNKAEKAKMKHNVSRKRR